MAAKYTERKVCRVVQNPDNRTTARSWLKCFVAFALFFSTSVFGYEIWYQDTNFGRGGVLPKDFVYRFENPDVWAQARDNLDVHMFRANWFNFPQFTDVFVSEHLRTQLQGAGVKIAINSAAPLFAGCRDRTARFDFEMELMSRVKRLGLEVSYVSLQSILSKPQPEEIESRCTTLERINGGIDYAKRFLKIFPKAEFGIIDALPSHGKPYREVYKLARDMFEKSAIPLGYIHLDVSADQVDRGSKGLGWTKLLEVERYVKRLGLKFGIFLTSRRAGYRSDEAFYHTSIRALDSYLAVGGNADHYVTLSWFPHPRQTVAKNNIDGKEYPATDLILEFRERLDQRKLLAPALGID